MISGRLHDASWLVTDRTVGSSQGAFACNNLALHVGDDADVVKANRRALAREIGQQAVVFPRARHGDQVGYVTGLAADVPGVDALIADRADVAVAAQAADCVVFGLATPDGWVAAVHCGWRGLVAGVVTRTVETLVARGADLTGALAHLGPSICASCYPVGQDCFDEVARAVPQAAVDNAGQLAVDVRAGVLAQLAEAGIRASVDRRCTAEDADLYSHRRDGITGRQALVIVRRGS